MGVVFGVVVVVGGGVVGQAFVLQLVVCLAWPVQLAPPLAGRGFVQDLSRKWVPPPQVFEHGE